MFSSARQLAVMVIALLPALAWADGVQVAVAANFKKAAEEIGVAYTKATGNKVEYAYGATGQFAMQIRNGAPFDVLLAADDSTAPKLAQEGFALADTGFVYARGALVLYSTTLPVREQGLQLLRQGQFEHLAVANPKTAPYGAAALQALQSLHLLDQLQGKIVQGNDIGQTFEFVATGNAQLGFVALSQAIAAGRGQWLLLSPQSYAPINQSAILLKPGADKAVARDYLKFLRGPEARALIEKYGYTIPH